MASLVKVFKAASLSEHLNRIKEKMGFCMKSKGGIKSQSLVSHHCVRQFTVIYQLNIFKTDNFLIFKILFAK